MSSRWLTFEKLICELGSIRAFTDEADAFPEVAGDPAVTQVRVTMAEATGAISRTVGDFTDQLDESDDQLVIDAWTALARAQDAVARARGVIDTARNARRRSEELLEKARRQREDIQDWTEAVGAAAPARHSSRHEPKDS